MESAVRKLKQSLKFGWLEKKKKKDSQKERWFLENGSILLKELIADCNGKSIPIRSFSSDQIHKATNNFGSRFSAYHDSMWFEGIIEDRCYLIKLVPESSTLPTPETAYNDIVLSARMSNHSNFLKLVGYCLEFRLPVLVFEDIEYGFLNNRGGVMVDGEEYLLPLSLRLKIGKEVANALTYLHTAFLKITIHRDVKPMIIALDKKFTAKLSDLSISITLPEGKSRLETVVIGTPGYLDPSYFATSFVTEYTDVYSFGVLLMVLLTGRPSLDSTGSDGFTQHILSYVKGLYENGKLDELIDPVMMEDMTNAQKLQVEACVVLALRCCEERDEDRPTMIQVAKELKRIEAS